MAMLVDGGDVDAEVVGDLIAADTGEVVLGDDRTLTLGQSCEAVVEVLGSVMRCGYGSGRTGEGGQAGRVLGTLARVVGAARGGADMAGDGQQPCRQGRGALCLVGLSQQLQEHRLDAVTLVRVHTLPLAGYTHQSMVTGGEDFECGAVASCNGDEEIVIGKYRVHSRDYRGSTMAPDCELVGGWRAVLVCMTWAGLPQSPDTRICALSEAS